MSEMHMDMRGSELLTTELEPAAAQSSRSE
jgi:hypothetical protein